MPYSSVSEVPGNVPKDKRRQWMHVWNSAYSKALEDGKSKAEAESSAFAQANGVIKAEEKFMANGMGTKELFARIIKISDVDRTVQGLLVAEDPDMVDEIWDYDSSKAYFQAWNSKFAEKTDGESVGNLRSMHNKIAAGKFLTMDYNDDDKSVFVTAKVVDNDEWEKVRERVYTGFSIGAKYVRKWRDGRYTRWTGDPYEGSLVDNPAIPKCTFVHKFADGTEVSRPLGHNPEDADPAAQKISAEKGMGRISHFAQVLDSLNSALEMARYEHQASGRKSHALDRLHTHAGHLHDAFAAYTQEQVDEHKKSNTHKTISEEDDMQVKELREKFVQLQKQVGEALKAMDDHDADDKPDHSAEDCKDADCKYHGKSKSVSGSGGPDESSHGAPTVGSPKESESTNATWSGKVAGIETAQKAYDDRLGKIEELLNEATKTILFFGEQLKPTTVVKTVAKSADTTELTNAEKVAAEKIDKLRESDPMAASVEALKLAQQKPHLLVGGTMRSLPAPDHR